MTVINHLLKRREREREREGGREGGKERENMTSTTHCIQLYMYIP